MRGSFICRARRRDMRSSLLSSWQWTDPIWNIWLQLCKTHEGARSATLSFSPCLLNSAGQESNTEDLRDSICWQEAMSEPRNSSLISLYLQEAKAANNKQRDRPVWVQTRAQQGEPASMMKLPEQKRKRKAMDEKKTMAVIEKQRQSPLSSWIGKQLLGQNVSGGT